MIQEWVAEQWTPSVSHHAEGPMWDGRANRLFWVDQYEGLIRSASHDADARVEFSLGAPLGAVVPEGRDGWVVAVDRGFAHLSSAGDVTPLADVLPDDGIRRRMNDGKCDPAGRLWAGSMAFDKTRGASTLYVLDRGVARAVRGGFTISNGTAWTPDGSIMFHIDSPTRKVDRYRIDEHGGMHDGGIAFRIAGDEGFPDGMCIDAEGALWVALWGAGVVHRYTQDGELLGIVRVGTPQVSSCTFGGPNGETLFITTSRENYSAVECAAYPNAGAIFAVQPGVSGLPADAYRT